MISPVRIVETPRSRCLDAVGLRRVCEREVYRPPSVAETQACMRAWARCDPSWAERFFESREQESSGRASTVYAILDRLAPWLSGREADAVFWCSEQAVCESLADVPLVLVLVRADRSVIVADLAGQGVWVFERPARRRPWWGWWL